MTDIDIVIDVDINTDKVKTSKKYIHCNNKSNFSK